MVTANQARSTTGSTISLYEVNTTREVFEKGPSTHEESRGAYLHKINSSGTIRKLRSLRMNYFAMRSEAMKRTLGMRVYPHMRIGSI